MPVLAPAAGSMPGTSGAISPEVTASSLTPPVRCTSVALQARQLLGPGLPQVNEEIMKAARAGIFQNVLFGGVMSDVMQVG